MFFEIVILFFVFVFVFVEIEVERCKDWGWCWERDMREDGCGEVGVVGDVFEVFDESVVGVVMVFLDGRRDGMGRIYICLCKCLC